MGGRRLVVEADGGSRGNPGEAGYGALVRDAATGTVIAERAEPLGVASNNVAEYSGLVAGLKAAREIEPGADVEVRMDSKLVVEQMSGRWKVKHEGMRRLAVEAREVAADISAAGGSVRYVWIPRAENFAADLLANSAMDGTPVSWTAATTTAATTTAATTTAVNLAEFVADPEGSATQSARLAAGGAPDIGAPTRVVLLRHGVTDFTVAGKLDGRGGADPSLNQLGRSQAAAAGAAVRAFLGDTPARVVTSMLARAIQTGAEVASALGVDAVADADWDEQNFGDWDGKSIGQLTARFPEEVLRLRDELDYARPGGESHEVMAARVRSAFGRVAAAGGSVVVATHRKPIMVVLTDLLGIPHDRVWRLATSPASLTAVEVWSDGGASVAFVNDTSHLR